MTFYVLLTSWLIVQIIVIFQFFVIRKLQKKYAKLKTYLFTKSPQLSKNEIKLLKQLCHPDKHNNGEAANKAIKILNNLTGD